MQAYGEYQPTGFDRKGVFLLDQQNWPVLSISQTRDSGPLERSNFIIALRKLGGESETVEVHRFGHWACGWYETILIDPTDKKAMAIAEDIERAIENYSILCEEHYSELEWEEKLEVWSKCYDISERVKLCQRAGASIFAARRTDEIPEDVDQYISLC